jgi:PKD repeat protein
LKARTLRRGILTAILVLFILNIGPSFEAPIGTQPFAAFTYNPCVACAAPGDVVFFNANTSQSGNGPIVSYTWDFGDGSPLVKTNTSYQTHDFLQALPGKWQVTLTVQDSSGMTDTISQLVLFNVAPDFTIRPIQPPAGFPVTFNASNTRIYQSPTPTSPMFQWSFGDGSNGTGVLVAHKYFAPGPYRVLLTVVTSDGAPTISKTLIVRLAMQGVQEVQASFDNINITVTTNIAANTTTHLITGTVAVVATNTTTGATIFSNTFNITMNGGPDNSPRRFVIMVGSTTPTLAATCSISPATDRLSCFASRDPDITVNGTIDIVDLGMATYDYGATQGSSRYNPAVDLDDNGRIDIIDVGILTADYAAPIF